MVYIRKYVLYKYTISTIYIQEENNSGLFSFRD